MLVGLALRALSRWLQDHVGIDVENSGCNVEYLGSSHVVVRLQDAALTEALWSFFVGPLLPITTHSGRVREVVVEISPEAFSVDVRGVVLRLRKMELPEVLRVAGGHRTRTLKDRDRLLSSHPGQNELKRWVKARLRVSASELAVVLHDEAGPERCGPCSLALLCRSVVFCDPDAATATTARAALPAQGDDAQLPVVPVHIPGRDALYLMAKDVFATEARLYLTVGKPLPADFSTDVGAAGSWSVEDAICPLFSLYVAYRAWDPGALVEIPDCARGAKKTMALQVCPLELPAEDPLPTEAAAARFLISLDAGQFAFLTGFLGNLDSLFMAWSVALAESVKDISAKPSGAEASRYLELWRQYRAAPAFGRSRELCDLEWRFGGGYVARMRRLAMAAAPAASQESSNTCCTSTSANAAASGESEGSLLERCSLEGDGSRSRRAMEISPRISAKVLQECFRKGSAADVQHGAPEAAEDGVAPPGGEADSAKVHSGGASDEFAVDSAYRIVIPDLGLKLNCTRAAAESGALLAEQVSFRGILRIHLPRFSLRFARDLDNRHLSLRSARARLEACLPADLLAGESFCSHVYRDISGPLPQRVSEAETLLDWKGLELTMDYFGENFRELGARGELSAELPALWPCLQDFPGLRPTVDLVQVFGRWYPGEELPTALCELLAPALVVRYPSYVFNVPSLNISYAPDSKELPRLELRACSVEGKVGPLDACLVRLTSASIRRRDAGRMAQDLLVLRDAELARAPARERGERQPLAAALPVMEVNLTPYLLHVFAHHWQAYDPRPIFRRDAKAATPREEHGVPNLPNLTVTAQGAVFRLWEEAGAAPEAPEPLSRQSSQAEPRLQLRVRGMEWGSSSGGRPARQEATSQLRVKIAGLLGDLQSCEGSHSVFLCTHLDGVPLHDEDASPAVSAAATWAPEWRELDVSALYLHLAPTVELLQRVRMLVPGALGGKANHGALGCLHGAGQPAGSLRTSSQHSQAAAQGSSEPEAPRRPPPARGDEGHVEEEPAVGAGKGRADVLRIQGLCLGLHFSAWGQEPVLLRTPEAAGSCGAGAVGTLDSAYLGAQGLSASAWADGDGRTLEASVGCAYGGVVRRHASGWDQLPPLGQTASSATDGSAEAPRGVELIWVAALESVSGVAVLPLPSASPAAASAAQRILRTGALCIQSAALWSTDAAGELAEGGPQGLAASRAEALCGLCPFVPKEHALDHMCQLLSARGPEPWITLSLGGAAVSGCEGPGGDAAEGFYAVQPFLCGGGLVYQKVDGPHWLTRAQAGEWKISPCVPEGVADRSAAAAGTKLCSPAGSPRPSSGRTSAADACAEVPGAFQISLGGGALRVQLRLAPTALVIPKVDVSPVVRLPQQIKHLLDEVREPKSAEIPTSSADVEPTSEPEGPARWHFYIVAELSVGLKDRAACPTLRLRCTPRPKIASGHSVCELKELSLELLQDARGADGQGHVSLSLSNIHIFSPSTTPDLVLAVSVASISGRQVLRERHSMFVRKFDVGMHLKLKFSPGKELFLYLAPTAVRLHRDWMEPLVILLTGLSGLFRASKFNESRKAGLGIGQQDSWHDPNLLWEGPLWELNPEGGTPAASSMTRRWLQVMADGYLKDVQAPLRPCLLMKGCQPRPSALFGWRLRAIELGTSTAFEFAFDTQRDASLLRHLTLLLRIQDSFQQSPPPLSNAPSRPKSEHVLASEPASSLSRLPSMLAMNATRQVAGRLGQSMGWITNASASAVSGQPTPRGSAARTPSTCSHDSSASSRAELGMSIYMEVRSLEFWLPTSADLDDDRELGFLLAAEAHGVTGTDVVATMHHFVAMHASPGCWQGQEEDAESVPESADPEDHEAILESSFAPITHWTPSETVGGSPVPGSPAAAGGQPPRAAWASELSAARPANTPLWQAVLGEAAEQLLGWPAGKLMETRGLAMVLLWEPRPTAGVRLEGVEVRVPAEMLQCWPVIQEHIAALKSHGKEGFGSNELDSPVSLGLPHDQAAPPPASAQAAEQLPQPERRSCLPFRARERVGGAAERGSAAASERKAPSAALRRGSLSSLGETMPETVVSEQKDKSGRIWKFEFDVIGQVEVTFSGGLLAPAHWLQARFSDIMFRGNLPLQESSPLGGILRCDIACYDGQTAQLQPVLESVEITVDMLRSRERDELCLSMARVNLNVHRVLVDFLETVRRKLRDTQGVLLKPLRSFQIRNETGVMLRLQWPDSAHSLELEDEQHALINMPALDDRGVRLTFHSEPPLQLEDEVMVDLDYKHGRAYLLRASRCIVFIEPQHDVQEDGQCTCTLHVRSAVSIHNNTAIPLHIFLHRPLGLARDQLSSFLRSTAGGSGPLVIQPHGKAKCVPLSWFTVRGGTTYIKPAAGDIPLRFFSQLSTLLEGRLSDEHSFDDPLPRAASSLERPGRQLLERMKFNLFFATYMKLIGYVNAYDVPMSEVEDMLPSQRYEMHLENVVSFRNMLPFPVILQLCAIKGVLEEQEFPIDHVHQAFHGSLPCAEQEDVSPSLDLEASAMSLRCFAQVEAGAGLGPRPSGVSEGSGAPKAMLQRRTELDNILQLTLGRTRRGKEEEGRSLGNMVASYVLGVDQELKLPFAKRSLHFRLLALVETSHGMAGAEESAALGEQGVELGEGQRPQALHPLLASTTQCLFLPPVHSDKLWVPLWERSDGAPLLPASEGCPGCRPPDPEFGGQQSLQVGLELTRNAVVLFAPAVLENLTPFSLHINPEDLSCQLGPLGRRVLPRSLQIKDAVYFAISEDDGARPFGQEVFGAASGAPAPERPAPLPAPGRAAAAWDPGLLLDGLSLGLCVRTGAPPLRLTKVVSVVPRFFARSELESAVRIHFDGYPDCEGRLLNPHEKGVPLHPPSKSFASEGGPRVYLTDGARKSNAFAMEQRGNVENKRNFHVRMGTASPQSSQPHFVQVVFHQAVFPGEETVLHSDCSFIVLRLPDFRGSEDSLFHMENCTPLGFFARFTEQRAVLIEPMGSDGHASHQWVHQVDGKDLNDMKDKDKRCPAALEIYQDHQCKGLLQTVDLEKVAEFRPNAVVANFSLQAVVQRWSAKEAILGRIVVNGLVTLPSEVSGFSTTAELTFQSLGPPDRARVFVVRVGRVGSTPEEAEAVREVFQDRWALKAIGGRAPEPGLDWRGQLLQGAPGGVELTLEVCVEVRHVEGADGVHHFALQSAGGEGAAPAAASAAQTQLKVFCPVLSVSWVYNSHEVLAARVKGLDLQLTRDANGERNDDCGLEVSAQHLQVDHFLDGELPVVLNRRFLHINSRLLGKKAFFMKVKWVLGSRSIHLLRIDVVPYWLNLELGVLIRLWELAEGSFSSLLQRRESRAVPLDEPQLPSSGEEQQAAIWRLMKLVVEPLKVTIMVRSPDPASVRDSPTARWILRLPTDMPNMDLFLPRIKEPNISGTTHQLLGWLSRKYTKRVKYSALWSIFLSYLAAILKGILNALWWLARGPYDAIQVAQQTRLEMDRKEVPGLWWASPAVHGISEGTYRAMAELLGNSIFGVVLVLNAIRQLILNTTRPRAQSILDGFVYGFRGLVLDSLVTPIQQLLIQTQIAFQDWGALTASVVFCLSLIRLPLGPFLGVTHFAASSCEGLVNILLHEEAQFAPFEPQRIIEGASLRPMVDTRESLMGGTSVAVARANGIRRRTPSGEETQRAELPRRWWLFPRLPRQLHMVSRAIADDDEAMENFSTIIIQQALRA